MKSIVLFRSCDAQTSLCILQTQRRWADWIVTAWLASSVSMVGGVASLLLLGSSTFEIVLMLSATAVSLATAVPAIILLPAVGEFERELSARGALPPIYVTGENRVRRYFGRMLLFVLLVGMTIAASCWFGG
jgi:hypothetical protein